MAEEKSSTVTTQSPLLVLKGVSKSFGAVQALTDVDFEVSAGEVVGLVGDNGAGKSTLIKAVSGVQPADKGEMWFDGKQVEVHSPQEGTALGIATVYQDLALCDNLDVVANLFLGQEVTDGGPGPVNMIDETAMERRSVELLASLSVTTLQSVRQEVASLSGGQRQSVAIARAMLGEPRLVILDEPTAALGVVQTRQVLDLIKQLRDRGLALIMISHNLANVFEVSDRIIVLRLGRRAATFRTSEVTHDDVVAAITGAALAEEAR